MNPTPPETGVAPSPSLADFMTQAIAMELEARERYEEFADAMETHNNREVAAMFRKLAAIEGKHADQLLAEMGWSELSGRWRASRSRGSKAPRPRRSTPCTT